MGLDNLIYEEIDCNDGCCKSMQPIKDAKVTALTRSLCGGILTDDSYSFRGKVYDDLVDKYSGLSLYNSDKWTDDDYFKLMTNMFVDKTYGKGVHINEYGHQIQPKELLTLRKLIAYIYELRNSGRKVEIGAWY